MEGELWKGLYAIAEQLAKELCSRGTQISDRWIVLTYLWAVLHDRPVSWACDPGNWPPSHAGLSPPSPSTMSRRLRTASVQRFLQRMEQLLRDRSGPHWYRCIDARPLTVGGSTHDRQARYGRAAGCYAKGYKLYAIWGSSEVLEAWEVHPMNVSEKAVARELISGIDGEGYLVGDGEYDANVLYDLAAAQGMQLLANKRSGRALGHRRQSPHRLRALQLLDRPFGQYLLGQRVGIDRFFGHMSNFGGGLSPLPNWVRTLPRVRWWVQAKIIINSLRLTQKQRLTA